MACRCAPSLVALRHDLDRMFPSRDRASDGCCGDAAHLLRKSDHNPDSSGYAHAHDFDEGIGSGPAPLLWLKAVLLRDRRTKYVIYERRIAWPDGTDRPYTGPNAHDHHLHLSILSTATHDTRPWLDAPEEGFLMALTEAEQREILAFVRENAGRVGALDTNADGRMEHTIESVNKHVDMVVAHHAEQIVDAIGQDK